jgi:elongation factor P
MLSLGQVRPGAKILWRNEPYEIIEANHHKMGRGGAKLVTKLRNLINRAVIDYTFAGDERLEEADIRYRSGQFLYSEGNESFFMTNDDFSQFTLVLEPIKIKLLKDGEAVDLMLWKDQAIDVKLPPKVELKITYTEPGFKGNTASAAFKGATLETGASIQVPLFLNIGDTVRVSTETGTYDSRV